MQMFVIARQLADYLKLDVPADFNAEYPTDVRTFLQEVKFLLLKPKTLALKK